jgi:hypothetical protein
MARAGTVVTLGATEDSLVDVFQHQLQAGRVPGTVTHQLGPVAGQQPQALDVGRRDERGRQQAVLEARDG